MFPDFFPEKSGKKNEKPQVQLVRVFFFFEKQFKIRKNFCEFSKKCQKLKNAYFLTPKTANID